MTVHDGLAAASTVKTIGNRVFGSKPEVQSQPGGMSGVDGSGQSNQPGGGVDQGGSGNH